jgi:hypothetical protein
MTHVLIDASPPQVYGSKDHEEGHDCWCEPFVDWTCCFNCEEPCIMIVRHRG